MLDITGVVVALLCLADTQLVSTMLPSIALACMAAACLVAHWINRRGAYYAASALFLVALVGGNTFIIAAGDGLRDSGMLGLPVIIVAGTLLYGRRAALPLLAATLVAVATAQIFGTPAVVPGEEGLATRLVSTVTILAATAAFMGVVTDDADRHRAGLLRSQRELHRAYELTLEGWARILEFRDEETEGHSRRVADLAVALARELGLDEDAVVQVRRGALLHDIGKLGIPDHILLKPGPLDREERTIMEQHPIIAHEMLAGIPFLRPALAIPLSHHERWDGAGYPEGLAGEEIPLLARLFAVVDQWEALTSNRPYRAAWPAEAALRYVRDNAGSAFDPRVVVAFERVLERLAAIPAADVRIA